MRSGPTAAAVPILFVALSLAGWAQEPARLRGPQAADPDALAIIVHQSNPTSDLTLSELRRIFMLEKQAWSHGRRITLVLRAHGQPDRDEPIRLICGLSPVDYDRHVLFQTFRGSVGQGPRSIESAYAMQRFVFNAPGAIGYVWADEWDRSTKILRIDGALPGDPKYALHRPPRARHLGMQ